MELRKRFISHHLDCIQILVDGALVFETVFIANDYKDRQIAAQSLQHFLASYGGCSLENFRDIMEDAKRFLGINSIF